MGLHIDGYLRGRYEGVLSGEGLFYSWRRETVLQFLPRVHDFGQRRHLHLEMLLIMMLLWLVMGWRIKYWTIFASRCRVAST